MRGSGDERGIPALAGSPEARGPQCEATDVNNQVLNTPSSVLAPEAKRLKNYSGRKQLCTVFFGCLLGLLLIGLLLGSDVFSTKGVRDFTGFWIGTKLLGTALPYDIKTNLALQKAITGKVMPGIIFVRLPFWALLIKPFTLFPYTQALLAWKVLMTAALVGFIWYFPLVGRRWTALALCWSLPAALAITASNDAPLMLLLIGISLYCWREKRPVLAGMMLGLCLAKFHFLFFLPLLLFQKRFRETLKGFLIVCVGAVALNFLIQPDWIRLYWTALTLPQENMNAHPTLMPNLYASFFRTGHAAAAIAAGAVLIAWILWNICRRAPFELAMPLCILAALLVSPHTNHLDGLLTIPALLLTARCYRRLRPIAYFLLSPVAALLYSVGPEGAGPLLFVSSSVWLMYGISRDPMADSVTLQFQQQPAG